MDIASIAAAAVAARQAATAGAILAAVIKGTHQQAQSLITMLEAAAQSGKEARAEVTGSAGLVDISV